MYENLKNIYIFNLTIVHNEIAVVKVRPLSYCV